MADVVVWTGPVNFQQVGPGATLAGAREINIGCFGDRQPHCPTIAGTYLDADGRRLPRMLAAHGLTESELGDLVIGAFSAGGSLVKRLLLDARDRAAIDAVHLADASYTSSWENQAKRQPPPIDGYVLYALDAIDGQHLFVATASPIPNKTWASGVENLQRLRAEVEKVSGRTFEKLRGFYGIDPAPDAAYKLGNVILAEYPLQPIGHGHNVIASQVWDKIIKPWLAQRGQAPAPSPGGDGPAPPVPAGTVAAGLTASSVALFVGAAATGYFAVRLGMRKFW